LGAGGRVPAVPRGLPVGALFAYSQRGYVHEDVVLGMRLPTVLAALLVMMAVCAALSWLHFRRDAYTAFEETSFGALLGIAVFGLILLLPLLFAA
jgi:lysylphosphatidylglycerol synthetase-like protein (DUF2156 family)